MLFIYEIFKNVDVAIQISGKEGIENVEGI